jgi:hypothetical protein
MAIYQQAMKDHPALTSEVALAKLYYIGLLFVEPSDATARQSLTEYREHLKTTYDIKASEINRYKRLLDPDSWFIKWIVGGVGHLLGVILGIWFYSLVEGPGQDSAFKQGITGGGALVGMLHQLFTDKAWPTFATWMNRKYSQDKEVTLSDSEITKYLIEIQSQWLKQTGYEIEDGLINVRCGLSF